MVPGGGAFVSRIISRFNPFGMAVGHSATLPAENHADCLVYLIISRQRINLESFIRDASSPGILISFWQGRLENGWKNKNSLKYESNEISLRIFAGDDVSSPVGDAPCSPPGVSPDSSFLHFLTLQILSHLLLRITTTFAITRGKFSPLGCRAGLTVREWQR